MIKPCVTFLPDLDVGDRPDSLSYSWSLEGIDQVTIFDLPIDKSVLCLFPT